jgi:hypothetical protein
VAAGVAVGIGMGTLAFPAVAAATASERAEPARKRAVAHHPAAQAADVRTVSTSEPGLGAAPAARAAPALPTAPLAEAEGSEAVIDWTLTIEKQPDGSLLYYHESPPTPPSDDGTDVGTALIIEREPSP